MDSSKLINLGWEPKINLEEGIKITYRWYLENLEVKQSINGLN
jgi:GDP-L-fucose synthase